MLHLLSLFVCLFVCSFGWLLCRLSAPCPHVSSRLVTAPRRYAASHLLPSVSLLLCHCIVASLRRHVVASSRRRFIVSLRHRVVVSSRCHVVASSHRRVSSCLVIVLCPLTHLIMPALFDCCVFTLHLIASTSTQRRHYQPSLAEGADRVNSDNSNQWSVSAKIKKCDKERVLCCGRG